MCRYRRTLQYELLPIFVDKAPSIGSTLFSYACYKRPAGARPQVEEQSLQELRVQIGCTGKGGGKSEGRESVEANRFPAVAVTAG